MNTAFCCCHQVVRLRTAMLHCEKKRVKVVSLASLAPTREDLNAKFHAFYLINLISSSSYLYLPIKQHFPP